MNVLADGTDVGGTYLAVYNRSVVEPSWRRAPRGFELHLRHGVPRAVRAELRARGWDYRIFDTGRLVNLLLLLEGRTLENRDVPQLHHVGGLSGTQIQGAAAMLRSLPRLIRPGVRPRLKLTSQYVAYKLMLWRRLREPQHRLVAARRSLVSAHVRAAIAAIEAGELVPPAPGTDSAEVDARLAALTQTLGERYRPLAPA